VNPDAVESSSRWHLSAGVAAWLFPGLGHMLLGQKRRGIILAVGIGGLWLAGFLIGGINTFDRTKIRESIVQVGQVALAASWAAYYLIHDPLRPPLGADPLDIEAHRFQPSLGRTNEQAVLYTALAGMLNFLAIVDVLYRDPRDPRHRRDRGRRRDEDEPIGAPTGAEA
jgi:hypothetical protein